MSITFEQYALLRELADYGGMDYLRNTIAAALRSKPDKHGYTWGPQLHTELIALGKSPGFLDNLDLETVEVQPCHQALYDLQVKVKALDGVLERLDSMQKEIDSSENKIRELERHTEMPQTYW